MDTLENVGIKSNGKEGKSTFFKNKKRKRKRKARKRVTFQKKMDTPESVDTDFGWKSCTEGTLRKKESEKHRKKVEKQAKSILQFEERWYII